jgi:hypothetical protein
MIFVGLCKDRALCNVWGHGEICCIFLHFLHSSLQIGSQIHLFIILPDNNITNNQHLLSAFLFTYGILNTLFRLITSHNFIVIGL